MSTEFTNAPDTPTPEQQVTLDDYSAKLNELTGGAYEKSKQQAVTQTQAAAKPLAPQPPSPARQELDKIMKQESYWKGDHPDHAKTMQRDRQLMVAESVLRGEGDDFKNADHPREDATSSTAWRTRASISSSRGTTEPTGKGAPSLWAMRHSIVTAPGRSCCHPPQRSGRCRPPCWQCRNMNPAASSWPAG